MGAYEPRHEITCFSICKVRCAVPRSYIDNLFCNNKSEISNYLLLLNSPVFVGDPGQVSLGVAHIMSCFNNMFFQSFHHHSRVAHMYNSAMSCLPV